MTDAEQLAALIEHELEQRPPEQRSARLHFELATLSEESLGDLNRAAQHFQIAARLSNEHKPSLRGARRTLAALRRYQDMLPYFDAELRATKKPEKRAALLFAKGAVVENELRDTIKAREVYREALQLDPCNVAVLKALERCERRTQAWDSLDDTYERLANAVQEDVVHRAAVLCHRGQLAEVRHGDPAKSAGLYQAALSFDPTAPAALAELKRLEHEWKQWPNLIALLRGQLKLSTDLDSRVLILLRIAEVFREKLGDLGQAIAAIEQAVSELPQSPLLLEKLADMYADAERHEATAQTLARLFDVTTEEDKKVALAFRLGRHCELKLNDDTHARRWYEIALEKNPCFAPVLAALDSLYERAGDWKASIAMHHRHIAGSHDDETRAVAHETIANLWEIKLQRPDEAARHYDQALTFVPHHEPSLKALSRLHAHAGRWAELVELYQRVVDQSPRSDRAVAYLFRIGGVYEDRLNNPGAAVHAYRRILDVDFNHLGAIQAVQRAAEAARAYDVLLEMIQREVELAAEKHVQIGLLCRAATVCHQYLGDPEGAILQLRRVLAIEENNDEALTHLAQLYEQAGRWEELLQTYEGKLQHTLAGPQRTQLIYQMGQVSEKISAGSATPSTIIGKRSRWILVTSCRTRLWPSSSRDAGRSPSWPS